VTHLQSRYATALSSAIRPPARFLEEISLPTATSSTSNFTTVETPSPTGPLLLHGRQRSISARRLRLDSAAVFATPGLRATHRRITRSATSSPSRSGGIQSIASTTTNGVTGRCTCLPSPGARCCWSRVDRGNLRLWVPPNGPTRPGALLQRA